MSAPEQAHCPLRITWAAAETVDGGLLVTLYGKTVQCTCDSDSYRTQHGPRGERCRHGQALQELGVMKPVVLDRAIQAKPTKTKSR